MANRYIPGTLVALAVVGCAAPLGSEHEPGVTVTARIALTEEGGRRLLQAVSTWTAAVVAHDYV